MTDMYPNVPLPKATMLRLPKIQQGLIDGLNYDQIAASCGVKSSQTIDRDMKAWVESGLFEVWLKTEFAKLYSHVKISNPVAAYKELAKIIAKMVTQKREIQVEENITEKQEVILTLDCLSPEERELARSLARRFIKTNNQKRPSSIH